MKISFLLKTIKAPPYNLPQAHAIDLISDLLQCDRGEFWFHINEDYWGSTTTLQQLLRLLKDQYPLPYLLRKKYFLGTDFYVDERVLIPRDETEGLVKLALAWLERYPKAKIVDLGTGSGVIGLSLKKAFPQAKVWLSDDSWAALQVAQKNSQIHNLSTFFLLGNYLKPLQDLMIKPNLLVVNPPYINQELNDWAPNLRFEPSRALFAPNNGLFFYQKLFKNLETIIDQTQPTAILLEFGYRQKNEIESLLNEMPLSTRFKINFYRDLNHHWRYLMLEMNYDVDSTAN